MKLMIVLIPKPSSPPDNKQNNEKYKNEYIYIIKKQIFFVTDFKSVSHNFMAQTAETFNVSRWIKRSILHVAVKHTYYYYYYLLTNTGLMYFKLNDELKLLSAVYPVMLTNHMAFLINNHKFDTKFDGCELTRVLVLKLDSANFEVTAHTESSIQIDMFCTLQIEVCIHFFLMFKCFAHWLLIEQTSRLICFRVFEYLEQTIAIKQT